MLPTGAEKLHVHSRAVVVGGARIEATVELALHPGGPIVAAVTPGPAAGNAVLDVGESLVVPAPLDLHFHGAGGHVVPPGGEVAAIDAVLRGAAEQSDWRHPDVPAPAYEWVATLPIPGRPGTDDPLDDVAAELGAAARAIADARARSWTGCVGLRVEGLYLSPARAGVWPADRFLPPSPATLEVLHAACADSGTPLRIVDVAPERGHQAEAAEFIRRCVELGIVASIAHTDATWEQARAAIAAGATLATHTWNAMRPTMHRDPGVVAAVLTADGVTCELICDGVHLHPGTVELSIAATGPARWVVVSDASPFAGCEPGTFAWAGTTVTHDGIALRDEAGRLAGSASLAWAARETLELAGASGLDAALAMGAVPRQVIDPSRSIGLQVGDPAWVVPVS